MTKRRNHVTDCAWFPSVEVFWIFLKLGLTAFGGPVAHLGYFQSEFVDRRRWMNHREFGELVAICQFLPGPASSQVGFAIGLQRAGFPGAFAAFVGFSLPSVAVMIGVALGASLFANEIGNGLVSGLSIVAVAIVAQAVWGMSHTLTPDTRRAAIAVGAIVLSLTLGGTIGQITAIAAGAVAGLIVSRPQPDGTEPPSWHVPIRRRTGVVSLGLFVALLTVGPLTVSLTNDAHVRLFDAFYRSGALVFGGGHVVLPLLEASVVDSGWMPEAQFLAGYGVAQALPGPLFSFAAYLGALVSVGPGGSLGALIATIGIFLPGFLLLVGILPFWNTVRNKVWAQAMMRGASAAVVGILAAALYSPVFTAAITNGTSFMLAAACFVLLVKWRVSPWVVVIVGACAGVTLSLVAHI